MNLTVPNADKVERGSKILKNLRTSYMDGPLEMKNVQLENEQTQMNDLDLHAWLAPQFFSYITSCLAFLIGSSWS